MNSLKLEVSFENVDSDDASSLSMEGSKDVAPMNASCNAAPATLNSCLVDDDDPTSEG